MHRLTLSEEFRLQAFRAARPDVIIGPLGFEAWQARLARGERETVTSRHTLKELLDRLDQLTSEPPQGFTQAAAPYPPVVPR